MSYQPDEQLIADRDSCKCLCSKRLSLINPPRCLRKLFHQPPVFPNKAWSSSDDLLTEPGFRDTHGVPKNSDRFTCFGPRFSLEFVVIPPEKRQVIPSEKHPTISYRTSKFFGAFWNRKLNESKYIKNSPTLACIRQ